MSGKREQGQALIELSLALSILLILSLGMVDVARVLHAYLTATNASREGARVAALGYDDADVLTAVNTSIGTALGQAGLSVVITPAKNERMRGEPVTVEVKVPVAILFPGFGAFAQDPLSVTARTAMRFE